MSRRFVTAAVMALLSGILLGCDGGYGPERTAPGTDTRSEQEKESDALLQKSIQHPNKKARR